MKALVRRVSRRFGLEVIHYRPQSSEYAQLSRLLVHHRIDLVLDVGANTGQYARRLRQAGYAGWIVSFEPLPEAREELLRNSAADSRWVVGPGIAIGDASGSTTLHVSDNLQSSSILAIRPEHIRAAPESAVVAEISTRVERLDRLWDEFVPPEAEGVFLKIDVQGYEDRVLEGCGWRLDRVRGIQVELSLVELYQGQMLFDDLIGAIRARGFELWALQRGFVDPYSGRDLQVDGLFFRPTD